MLPSKHHFTKLIIEFTHSSFAHQGVNSTLVRLRSKYWVPKGRQVVRKLISRCVICRRLGGTPFKHPDSPPLPSFRVKEKNPFEVTGVDFTGALYIKETVDTDDNKVYICLFTCAVTRNIHLELVRDLSAESFINCFRRFCSRKSLPRLVLSDNASTYKAASGQIKNLSESPTLKDYLSSKRTEWKFIPSRAPCVTD